MTVDEKARRAAARQAEIDALPPEKRTEVKGIEEQMHEALAGATGFIGITRGATAGEALAKGVKAAMVDAGKGATLQDPGSVGAPPAPPPDPPSSSAPPPYNDGMEARIGQIETRLTRVETKLDHIEKEVGQTKWWVAGSALTIILAMVATVLGTGIAIQQMTVATFQGAAQVARDAAPAAAPAQQQPIIINVPAAASQAKP